MDPTDAKKIHRTSNQLMRLACSLIYQKSSSEQFSRDYKNFQSGDSQRMLAWIELPKTTSVAFDHKKYDSNV